MLKFNELKHNRKEKNVKFKCVDISFWFKQIALC